MANGWPNTRGNPCGEKDRVFKLLDKELDERVRVSLRHLNKRFQIKQADREERVFEYLKNIWTVWKLFLDNFGVD